MDDRVPQLKRAAVVGAGWAGCAAAVTLARFGRNVTLYEAATVAGGRARRVVRDGLPLDNGQHLFLGAYLQTRNLLAAVHGGDGEKGLVRAPLALATFAGGAGRFALRARAWPGRLGLLAGVLAASGLSLRERAALLAWFRRLEKRGFRCDPRETVRELLADGPRTAAERLWNPLCLAALNTPPERASAQVFANVLRDAFAGSSGASDFLFASTDLTSLFPDAAIRHLEEHGGNARLGTRVRVAAGCTGITVRGRERDEPFDAAIVAVGPHQLAAAVEGEAFAEALGAASRLDYEPIATVWLGYAKRAPLAAPMLRLDDVPGQWIVDRPEVLARAAPDPGRPALAQLVAVVVSARGPHERLDGRALASACDAQLRRLEPRWPALAWSQAIVEKRATYACVPGRPLPPSALPHPRVALAGDWLDDEYPATIEAAVRTGVAAAFAVEQSLAQLV